MSELFEFTKEELQQRYNDKNGQWLYDLARGIDLEPVTPRLAPKSISCTKMFPRQNAIVELSTLKHWLHELAMDVVERVEQDELENNRRPKQIVVSFTQTINNADVPSSRSVTFTTNDEDKIVNDAIDVIKRNTSKFLKSDDGNTLSNPIKYLGYNVGKFESLDTKRGKTIDNMFRQSFQKKEEQTSEPNNNTLGGDAKPNETRATTDDETAHMAFLTNHHVEFREDDVSSSEDETVESSQNTTNQTSNSSQNISQSAALIEAANQINRNLQNHFLASPVASTSTKTNYHQTYAEWSYMPPEQELPKTECSQCGKMVVESEMQVHTDGHLAFQLNQGQRDEFQNQLKRTNASNTPVKKKPKISSSKKGTSTKNTTNSSIQKFLYKKIQGTPEPSTSTANQVEVDVERCTECGKEIPIVDLFEHMDFHAAKRLQNELMKAEIKANRPNNKNVGKTNASSSKSKKFNKKTTEAKNPAVRNITAFFQSIE